MTTAVIDASALLAYIFREPGAEEVEQALLDGAACSAVNYSEVAQKVRAAALDWNTAASILAAMDLQVVEATADDAVAAARLWQPGSQLSLADRFCLATAARLGVPIWTADSAWGSNETVRQIR